jgi:hypothetical protein
MMLTFLGDCVVGSERTRLLVEALKSPSGDNLRTTLTVAKPKGRLARGDADTIAQGLTTYEQLQLLLTLTDRELSGLIDRLTWDNEIKVPPAEMRQPDMPRVFMGLQLSSLGVRPARTSSVMLLHHLILDAYTRQGSLTDLDWRLRKPPDTSTRDALMEYLRRVKPPAAIDTLVLSRSPSE